jgi:hypothetical protein
MFQSELVNIRLSPSVPDGNARTEYDYELSETEPPVGPNLMMHLFENPDHAEVLPILYRRFPKKIRQRLEACPRKDSSTGWGLSFAERISPVAVFISGIIAFALCLLISIAWTVARDDVQGGFAIGGFLLAFSLFCGGFLHSALP